MSVSLVLTLIGEDKPGLVELLSQTVADHDGNWLESRMSRMAGRFAGILRAKVPDARAEALITALAALEAHGLRVDFARAESSIYTAGYLVERFLEPVDGLLLVVGGPTEHGDARFVVLGLARP